MKKLFALLTIFLLSSCANTTVTKQATTETTPTNIETKKTELFFIQKGATASYKSGILMINRTPAHTTYFINKPYKLSSHIANEEFFKRWIDIKKDENFKNSNPQATVFFYRKNNTPATAIVELSNPKIAKYHAITYTAKILSGNLPEIMGEVTLLIYSMPGTWEITNSNFDQVSPGDLDYFSN